MVLNSTQLPQYALHIKERQKVIPYNCMSTKQMAHYNTPHWQRALPPETSIFTSIRDIKTTVYILHAQFDLLFLITFTNLLHLYMHNYKFPSSFLTTVYLKKKKIGMKYGEVIIADRLLLPRAC